MAEYEAVLIYDGDCTVCDATSRAAEVVADVGVVPWQDEPAQRFLREQFGQAPFAMFLVEPEEERVYAGESAARALADRAGMPGVVSEVLEHSYDDVADIVGIVTQRDRDVDDHDDVYVMRDGAADACPALLDRAGDVALPSDG
jgi:hypothetical protein